MLYAVTYKTMRLIKSLYAYLRRPACTMSWSSIGIIICPSVLP